MKRIALFLLTNLAVVFVLSITASLLGLDRFVSANGLEFSKLLMFCALFGFGGSFISLWMSKSMAKMSTGARVITQPQNSTEMWLVDTVQRLATRAQLTMPEVAVYDGAPNAFATGATKNNSLVAVSTGLLQSMTKEEVEAVLAHEISHIANGDMVTLTLIQGVVNTFVMFLSRIVGHFVDSAMRKNDQESSGYGIGYTVTVVVCQLVFGLLASIIVMYFSRHREYRADAGAANLMGARQPMINALRRLGGTAVEPLPEGLKAAGISDTPSSWSELFSSHPPLESRIAALQNHAG